MKWWRVFAVGIMVFGVYLTTMARVPVGYGDSDELIGISSVLGLPHSPGYPLFTIMTFVFKHIGANVLAALLQTISVLLVWGINRKLQKNEYWALFGALFLAFSYQFWLYANVLEVFPLNHVLVLLVLFGALSIRHKWLIWFGLVGLMITHHHSSWLIMPGLLLWLPKLKVKQWFLGIGVIGAIVGVVGIVIVGLLNRQAAWSWQVPINLESITGYLFRSLYGGVNIEQGSIRQAYFGNIDWVLSINTLKHYLTVSLPDNWGWVGLGLILFGIWESYKQLKRRVWWGLLVMTVISGPILAAYLVVTNIQVLAMTERMYLLGFVVMALFIPFGLVWIEQKLKIKWLAIAGLILMIFNNYPGVNLSKERLMADTAKIMLTGLPVNSNLLCFSDFSCFSLGYAQIVDGLRNDVSLTYVTPQMYIKTDRSNPSLYPDSPFRIMEIIGENIRQGKRVFVAELPDFYIKMAGLDGRAYEIKPWLIGKQVPGVNRRNTYQKLITQQFGAGKVILYEIVPTADNYQAHLAKATKCVQQNDLTCAYLETLWATMKDTSLTVARTQLGKIYEQQGFLPLAKREYDIVLRFKPNDPEALIGFERLKEVPDLNSKSI